MDYTPWCMSLNTFLPPSPSLSLTALDGSNIFQVPTSMSAYLMHTDPSVYPDPFTFNPDRWLGDIDANMNRNFVAFSRGSRSCLGMKYNLPLPSLLVPSFPLQSPIHHLPGPPFSHFSLPIHPVINFSTPAS